MACPVYDIPCHIGGGVRDVVGAAAGNAIDSLANAVTEAVGQVVAAVATLWVHVPTPNLTTTPNGVTPSVPVAFIQGSLWWYMAAAAVLSVLIGAGKMAWEQRADPGKEVLKGLLTLVVVTGAGLTVIGLLVAAADQFAVWIIDRSVQGGGFGENLVRLLTTPAVGVLAAILVILLGLVNVFISLVQIGFLVARNGMLVILAGVLPTSTAFTTTEQGKAQFQKLVGWLVAFILYKPAAAIVYATAFKLGGADMFSDNGLISLVTAMMLMLLAVLALPALMRFAVPVVGALASGGGGGGEVAAAGAAVATGAIPVSRGGSGGGWDAASNGAGAPGPSGAAAVGGARGPRGEGGSQGPSGAGATNGSGPHNGNGAGPDPSGAGDGGAASSGGGGGGAGVGSSAGGGAAAGGAAAVAGPATAGGAAVAGAVKGAKDEAQRAAQSAIDQGGPSGS